MIINEATRAVNESNKEFMKELARKMIYTDERGLSSSFLATARHEGFGSSSPHQPSSSAGPTRARSLSPLPKHNRNQGSKFLSPDSLEGMNDVTIEGDGDYSRRRTLMRPES